MRSDETKTKAQLLKEFQELRQRITELRNSASTHREAENALTAGDSLLRTICEHAPLMIDAFDKEGRCILWNRECERIFGWTIEELNARAEPLALLYPDPEVRSEVMRTVISTPGDTFREWHPLTKDGETRVTLWANFQLPEGTVINFGQDITESRRSERTLETYRQQLEKLVDERTAELREVNADLKREISERKQAEDALRREKHLSERLITSSFDGIVAFDRNYVCTLWNSGMERITGATAEDVLGKCVFDAFPFLKETGEDKLLYQAISGKTVIGRDRFYAVPETGNQGFCESCYSPIRDESGCVIGGLGVIRDITERKRVEEELRQKKYIIESASNPIATADLDGNLTYVNPAYLETWGFDQPDEVLGHPSSEFWMVEDRLDEVTEALRAKGRWSGEVRARKKDGTLFDVQVAAATVYDNERNPIALMSSSVDITEQRRAEEALRASEQTVRALVETSRDWIWSIDLDARHTYCNQAIESILGYRPDELIGKRSLEFMHEEDSRDVEERLPDWIAGKQGWSNLLLRWRHKDGGWRFLESSAVPILDATGELVGFRGVDRDTTDRKRAEEELRKSEAKLRAILDYSPAIICTKDLDGKLTLVNRQFEVISGRPRGELIGKDVYDLFHRDLADRLWNCGLAAREGPIEAEETFRHRDGKDHTYWAVEFPLTDAGGNLFGTCVISTDITDRKRTEEQRLDLERQIQHTQRLESLGVMAGGIAHDFNNLLYVILGNADLALQGLSPASPARPLIEEAEKAAHRAADLTRQMLAYSGRARFEVKELNLSKLAAEMAQLIKSSVPKNVELKMNLRMDLPRIKADAAQLQQVIMNLISNAAEAIGTGRNGTVAVSTGTMNCNRSYLRRSRLPERPDEGEFAYLEVADSGSGMDEKTKERLFDPFFTTKFTGRGLGLSAVLGIVHGHRGAITVDSEAGEGTTIRVLLPTLKEPAESDLGQGGRQTQRAWRGRGTVLLVDDEEAVRTLAKRMLERMGFVVRTACDGRQAIETFRKQSEQISAVLLDLSMPSMDGEQTYRELWRHRADIPVILSSGYAEEEVEKRFVGQGIAGFIQKPYRREELRDALERILAN